MKVRQLRERGVKIKGLENMVTKEEVIERIKEETGLTDEEGQQMEIVRLITEPWMEKTALIKMPKNVAEMLREKGKIRIGWTVCKILRMRALMISCWRCGRFGHGSSECRINMARFEEGRTSEEAETMGVITEVERENRNRNLVKTSQKLVEPVN
ncbi:hypothetical protein WH47_06156 [Habropoda laboriosa]|uniref:CCHC-type domain-containing protein n=1 Tax=Habropoda laboriosa TaxID=597456 RepID=A0A0L7QT41_9HYME|nr:hypothetical protein WH47_06156 [Habropoda laboriosa]